MVLNCIQSAAKVIALITQVLRYDPIQIILCKEKQPSLISQFPAGPTGDETSFTTLDELKQEHQNRHHASTVKKKILYKSYRYFTI